MNYSERLNRVIPGGAHTYSRGDDQHPSNAPPILSGGKGSRVWSPDGREFLDYGMALRAVSIGYAEPEINQAAIRGLELGNSLTRASMIELEAAELLVSLIDSVDMVKFTKNGSTATSAAVKLARAYTGRELVARCAQHPFFSFDDWFIGSTPITKGIPADTIRQTKQFDFNDIASLEALIQAHPDQFACVILEPAATECPAVGTSTGCCGQAICTRNFCGDQPNYLQQVQALCKKHGIVFILDETITGFRWHMKGAQHVHGVQPDLSTFGKAMANGFSVAAVAGRREIMKLGSIDKPGQERLFFAVHHPWRGNVWFGCIYRHHAVFRQAPSHSPPLAIRSRPHPVAQPQSTRTRSVAILQSGRPCRQPLLPHHPSRRQRLV